MTETKIDLHFADVLGRDHVVRASLDGSGWRVRASLDGCAFTKHCGSWQAVERLVVLLRHRAGRPPASDASLPRRLAAAAVFVIAVLAATSAYAQPPNSPTGGGAVRVGDARLRPDATTEMFPCVTGALPPLPTELQYRIVGDSLVPVDVHASLTVDLLRNALAGLTVLDIR